MLFGFTGNILHVDLSKAQIEIEQPDETFYKKYLGGSLMGLYYLWKNTPKGTAPLSPHNTLVFAVSAPTGLPISGQSRCTVTCKSPSSGGVADSQAGGFWPAELKFAGFDAIVLNYAMPVIFGAKQPLQLTLYSKKNWKTKKLKSPKLDQPVKSSPTSPPS